jgi:glutamine cyclotransferase
VKVLRKFEHAHAPWTQGLQFASDGRLIETCGDYPEGVGSFVRELDPKSGKVQRSTSAGLVDDAGKNRFIEGIVEMGGRWFATTYEDKLAIEYDKNFKVVGTQHYPYLGWGLAVSPDSQSFLVTNGSEYVMSLGLGTWKHERTKVAHCMGKRLRGLNELEMVEDFAGTGPALLANLINTRLVFAMDPKTMECSGVFHLEDTESIEANERGGYHVANGIAYNKKSGTFVVTGKNWESMYEIQVSKAKPRSAAGSRTGEMLESYLSLEGEYKPPAHGGM